MSGSARHVLRAASSGRLFRARNSLVRGGRKETLSTREPGRLTWYACGPTVYDDAHLGHARTYVSFDVTRRILATLARVDVDFALGVTDVDDKIIARAAERATAPRALARDYEARFFADLEALNVLPPTRVLRVTEHIPELVAFVERLVDTGVAYPAPEGDVYFSARAAQAAYAHLEPSRMAADDEEEEGEEEGDAEGARGRKRDVRDFALWKGAPPGGADGGAARADPAAARWDSPWGAGRPGWHVECAAMASAALGGPLDVHSGGIDLRFPHHANELALATAAGCCYPSMDMSDLSSCASSGVASPGSAGAGEAEPRWAHTWLHAGHLHIAGRKMSKSTKNFVTVREFLADGGDADAFRVFCLLHRYAAPVDLDAARIAHAEAVLARARRFVRAARAAARDALRAGGAKSARGAPEPRMHPQCPRAQEVEGATRAARARIEDALVDDFDTPRALAAVAELIAAANRAAVADGALGMSGALILARAAAADAVAGTLDMLGVSGMREAGARREAGAGGRRVEDAVDAMVAMRSAIRGAARDEDVDRIFAICDRARDTLRSELGVEVQDGRDGGSRWEWAAGAAGQAEKRSRRQEAARRAGAQGLIQEEA